MARRKRDEPLELTSEAIEAARLFMELDAVDRKEIMHAITIRRAAEKRRHAMRNAPKEYDTTDALIDSLTVIATVQRQSRC